MSDRLKEALADMDWIHDVAADWPDVDANYEIIAAAARCLVEATETGVAVEWCETHGSRVRVGPGGRPGDERCTMAELHLAFDPAVAVRACSVVSRVLVDPRLLEQP